MRPFVLPAAERRRANHRFRIGKLVDERFYGLSAGRYCTIFHPAEAKEAGISGRVFTSFYIEVTGEITKVTVLKGLGFGCDEEAIRMIESMPKWKPGKSYGKPMRVKYNLPVSFDTR